MHRIKRTVLLLCLLLAGVYSSGYALWNMGKTAVFVHESTVVPATVIDMEKRPFESSMEALRHGNLPWDGDTAYRPIISCTLPTDPVPIHLPRLSVLDWDNRDYATGQQVDLILRLSMPEQAHLNQWKFLWGADCSLLLLGLLLAAAGYLPLKHGKKSRGKAKAHKPAPAPQQAPKPAPKPEPAPAPAPKPRKPRKKKATPSPAPADEEPFTLDASPAPKKPRSRKPKDPNAPAKPRKPRKKKAE